MNKRLKVGLYGQNGHQIQKHLYNNPDAEIGALCGFSDDICKEILTACGRPVKIYDSLASMVGDNSLDLISLCSPVREDQAKDAIFCLNAGKHVYAEKPAAFSENILDEILAVSKKTGCEFHEMADSVFTEPYHTVKNIVRSGKIGDVVQAYVQKSYPLNLKSRPQNEYKDGGLIRQAGIHAVRFLEHITGRYVNNIRVFQTHLGNSDPSAGLFTASSWAMTLEGGGVASACVNYLNPKGFGKWGNECVRIFGTDGMVEITDGAKSTHLYTQNGDEGKIDISKSSCVSFLDYLLRHLRFGTPMPMTLEEELHPLRVVIRAFDSAILNM